MVLMAPSRASCETSFRITSYPAAAITWAMPLPICPAPITPIRLISIARASEFAFSRLYAVVQKTCKCDGPFIPSLPNKKGPLFGGPLCLFDMADALSQFLGQFRHCLEQVCDQSKVGDLEDRGFFVFVDCDDDLAVLHTGQVLDRARDAAGDIQVRCNHFT